MAKNYIAWSANKVAGAVGVTPIAGKGKDEFISVSFSNDLVGKDMGVDGEGQFYDIELKDGEITVTLMRYSPTNAILSLAANNKLAFPFIVKNNAGTLDVFATKAARVLKQPDWKAAKAPGEVVWVLTYISGTVNFSEAKEQGLLPF